MAIHKIDGVDAVNNFPKKFVVLHALAAVTKGDILMIETDTGVTDYNKNGLGASVAKAVGASTTGDEGLAVIGVAAETITAAGPVKIQTAGKFENANVHTDVTRFEGIVVLDGTAGQGVAWTAATTLTLPFAIALQDAPSTGAATDIMIMDKGFF
tara:strand:- start:83 stop:547 length:465 start_codon:yes stop_codon:yes gene_type:complete